MNKRILVIDDDDAIRKAFHLSLEDTGYCVETVGSGEEGLERMSSGPYDLIFLDLKMPGLNGVQTLREIRMLDRRAPVYIITAFYGEFFDELGAAAREGIEFDVFRKPMGADQIVLVVRSVLEGPIGHP